MKPLLQVELPGLPLASRGKVRDIFHVGDDLLIVSTDRLSAFDVVLPDGIPDKGRVLTRLSEFWFRRFEGFMPHHLLTADADAFPEPLRPYRGQLEGRAMLVRRCQPLPVECVVRGYLAGSGWKDYRATGRVCGIELPPGLRQADRLPEPIFTPSTKARTGHDENITVAAMRKQVGESVGEMVEEMAIKLYVEGAKHALAQGIIIADTKFEFGLHDGRLMLIDEALTPDSSRFWDVDEYEPGASPAPSSTE
jgi:phosphoribosylaminoimidazole-succinocarboxamide synthase